MTYVQKKLKQTNHLFSQQNVSNVVKTAYFFLNRGGGVESTVASTLHLSIETNMYVKNL